MEDNKKVILGIECNFINILNVINICMTSPIRWFERKNEIKEVIQSLAPYMSELSLDQLNNLVNNITKLVLGDNKKEQLNVKHNVYMVNNLH